MSTLTEDHKEMIRILLEDRKTRGLKCLDAESLLSGYRASNVQASLGELIEQAFLDMGKETGDKNE